MVLGNKAPQSNNNTESQPRDYSDYQNSGKLASFATKPSPTPRSWTSTWLRNTLTSPDGFRRLRRPWDLKTQNRSLTQNDLNWTTKKFTSEKLMNLPTITTTTIMRTITTTSKWSPRRNPFNRRLPFRRRRRSL